MNMQHSEKKPLLSRQSFPDRHMIPLFQRASVTAFRYFTWVSPEAVLNAVSKPDPDADQRFLLTDADDIALGLAAHGALKQSRWIGLDNPDFWRVMQRDWTDEEYFGPLLERAGVRTLRTLYKGAQHISMMLQDGKITLKAMDSEGPGTWKGVKDRRMIVLPAVIDDQALGSAIRAALKMGRPSRVV